MRIEEILKAKNEQVVTAQETDAVRTAVGILSRNNIGAVVVLNDERRVVGIFSERDLVNGLHKHDDEALAKQISELMNRDLYICSLKDDVESALNWMTQYRVRHLPVIQGSELHGIVSIGDLVKSRLEQIETEANVLRDIVTAR